MLQVKRRTALQQHRLNSRNLAAWAIDADAYLMQTELFSKVRIKKTSEPECALLITCMLAIPSTPSSEIAAALAHVWEQAPLHYGSEYDAYEIVEHMDHVRMDFVTVASYGAVVTGRIEVHGVAS